MLLEICVFKHNGLMMQQAVLNLIEVFLFTFEV